MKIRLVRVCVEYLLSVFGWPIFAGRNPLARSGARLAQGMLLLMKYRVAAVSFLNTIPLIDNLVDTQVDLTRALPSRLAALLTSGEADVALVPVVEIFRGRAAAVVPGIGIACDGAVDSVKMFYRGELADLGRVRTDRGSRTSVALLHVLLGEAHDCRPVFVESEPVPGVLPEAGEGVLVIGDRCFAYEAALSEADAESVVALDLGAAWRELTGLPFIFAMWGVSGDFLGQADNAAITSLIRLLTQARDRGLAGLAELAAREAAAGKLGHKGEATPAAVAYYFRESLRYRLGEQEMAGLARFQELCIKHGLAPDGPAPTFL